MVAARESRAGWPTAPELAPWSAVSRAVRVWSVSEVSAVSMVPSQATPSWALRWYCWLAREVVAQAHGRGRARR